MFPVPAFLLWLCFLLMGVSKGHPCAALELWNAPPPPPHPPIPQRLVLEQGNGYQPLLSGLQPVCTCQKLPHNHSSHCWSPSVQLLFEFPKLSPACPQAQRPHPLLRLCYREQPTAQKHTEMFEMKCLRTPFLLPPFTMRPWMSASQAYPENIGVSGLQIGHLFSLVSGHESAPIFASGAGGDWDWYGLGFAAWTVTNSDGTYCMEDPSVTHGQQDQQCASAETPTAQMYPV